jgi:galactokinase
VRVVFRCRDDDRLNVVSDDALVNEDTGYLFLKVLHKARQEDPKVSAEIDPRFLRYIAGPFVYFSSPEDVRGADILVASDVPLGAGCSSSSALVVASALAARACNPSYKLRKRRDGRNAFFRGIVECEWEFSGVKGGCMDHLAIVYGRAGCVVSLDCRDEKVDAHVETDATFVLLDTKVKHDLEQSPYTDRRLACERCAKELQVASLRDVADLGVTKGLAQIDKIEKEVGQSTANRGRHVVEEICRVRRCATLLRKNKWRDVGLILYEAHNSLRDLFEASCDELDAAVDASRRVEGILGCRMVGGGFGGAALAVCAPGTDVDRVVEDWRDLYHVDGRIEPRLLVVEPGSGATLDGVPCVSIDELWATSGEEVDVPPPTKDREPSDFLRSLAARPIAKTASDAEAMAAYEAYVEAQLAKADS